MPDIIEIEIQPLAPLVEIEVSPIAVAGANATTQTFEAGESISGGNAVYANNGVIYRFNSNNVALQGRFLGIAKTAGNTGAMIDVYVNGVATIPTWGLTPNTNYFATTNGAIATSPSGVLNEMIGVAVASDKLLIRNLSIKKL